MSQAEPVTRLEGDLQAQTGDRTAAIRSTLGEAPETFAAFAEDTRRRVAELTARGDAGLDRLSAARDRLDHLVQAIAGLDLRQLEPRRGLAGLFDSRSRRLRAFRAAFGTAVSTTTEIASWLSDQAQATTAQHDGLDAAWNRIRDGIATLDDHISAGQAWLAEQDAMRTPSIPTPITEQTEVLPEQAHPLQSRLVELAALRATALRHLPQLRAQQNGEHRIPATLKMTSDAVSAWQADWRDVLGVSGPKPRKVRPDPRRLEASREELKTVVVAAQAQLEAALDRCTELERRQAVSESRTAA